jgi:single-strand DNA-binding protein
MSTSTTSTTNPPGESATNVVVLRGRVRDEPVVRTLPSGGEVVQFDVSTAILDRSGPTTVAVPVAWTDPPSTAAAPIHAGAEVVVIGSVRRRFFRVGGATQSRTEVIAATVIPARRARAVGTALTAVASALC